MRRIAKVGVGLALAGMAAEACGLPEPLPPPTVTMPSAPAPVGPFTCRAAAEFDPKTLPTMSADQAVGMFAKVVDACFQQPDREVSIPVNSLRRLRIVTTDGGLVQIDETLAAADKSFVPGQTPQEDDIDTIQTTTYPPDRATGKPADKASSTVSFHHALPPTPRGWRADWYQGPPGANPNVLVVPVGNGELLIASSPPTPGERVDDSALARRALDNMIVSNLDLIAHGAQKESLLLPNPQP